MNLMEARRENRGWARARPALTLVESVVLNEVLQHVEAQVVLVLLVDAREADADFHAWLALRQTGRRVARVRIGPAQVIPHRELTLTLR